MVHGKMLVHDPPLVHREDRFRGRRPIAEAAVRADGAVVAPPLVDQNLGLAERIEHFPAQELIAESGVEALALSRAARDWSERRGETVFPG